MGLAILWLVMSILCLVGGAWAGANGLDKLADNLDRGFFAYLVIFYICLMGHKIMEKLDTLSVG
jgi:hypothetical protein